MLVQYVYASATSHKQRQCVDVSLHGSIAPDERQNPQDYVWYARSSISGCFRIPIVDRVTRPRGSSLKIWKRCMLSSLGNIYSSRICRLEPGEVIQEMTCRFVWHRRQGQWTQMNVCRTKLRLSKCFVKAPTSNIRHDDGICCDDYWRFW